MSNYANPLYQQDMVGYNQPFGQYTNPGAVPQPPYQQPQPQPMQGVPMTPPVPGAIPFVEQSYIENILRLNRGKIATIYMNFENSDWGSQIFQGVVEAAGKDHIIISDPNTGMRYVLLMIYLNYITFDEEIEYDYPFVQRPTGQFTQAPIFNVPAQPPVGSPFPPQSNLRKKDAND